MMSFHYLLVGGGQNHYQLSLAFKKSGSNKKDKLYLKGWDLKRNEELSWEEQVGDRGDKRWKLQVFNSGTTRLESLSGAQFASNYDGTEDINCESNKLLITSGNFGSGSSWEKSVQTITLDTNTCDNNLQNVGCLVKITDNVGLKWGPELEKQLTFNK